MSLAKRCFIIILVVLLALCLSACSFSQRPYSARRLQNLLEKKYNSPGRFSVVQSLESPGDDSASYIFRDNWRNVDFCVSTSVGTSDTVPLRHVRWSEALNHGIMYANREQAVALAAEHGMLLVPVASPYEGGARATDCLYLHSADQIEDAAALFYDLYLLYDLEDPDAHITLTFRYMDSIEGAGTAVTGEQQGVLLETLYYQWFKPGEPCAGGDTSLIEGRLKSALQDRIRAGMIADT